MPGKYLLKLYVSGETPSSRLAISSLKNLIDRSFTNEYSLEVIKVTRYSELIEKDNIIDMPTLIEILLPSILSTIKVLKDMEHVLIGLSGCHQE